MVTASACARTPSRSRFAVEEPRARARKLDGNLDSSSRVTAAPSQAVDQRPALRLPDLDHRSARDDRRACPLDVLRGKSAAHALVNLPKWQVDRVQRVDDRLLALAALRKAAPLADEPLGARDPVAADSRRRGDLFSRDRRRGGL